MLRRYQHGFSYLSMTLMQNWWKKQATSRSWKRVLTLWTIMVVEIYQKLLWKVGHLTIRFQITSEVLLMNPLSVNQRIYCLWWNHRIRSGLDITLDEMPNNGVVLVVTSAGSHQLDLEKSIKEKSSKKNVKIYFTFSPFCREACGDSLPVYKRISDNRMFNLSDFSSKSFLETVVYTVWKKSFRFTHLHMWRSPINRSFYAQNQNDARDMLKIFF